MNYLLILAIVSALTVPTVYAANTPAAPTAQSAPVQKGNLKLAKKKDHSKADAPKKKSKK